jgi:AraC family transcriptional regulator of adaptative response/methylated-DNA-[protein]-cysteine methyltransferase
MNPVNPTPSATQTDYARVSEALTFICEHRRAQPGLGEVASHVGLSEHHFQRLFQRWAGISPKKFLQYLTVEHAKRALMGERSVLDAALDVGLSGPGRLHDLFVTVEGVSPGEFKRAGAGMLMRRGFADSPFGPALLSWTERGVSGLSFLGQDDRRAVQAEHAARWPGAVFESDSPGARALAERVFRSGPMIGQAEFRLLLKGTRFQLKVWEALLRIPPGRLTTYGSLARTLGYPAGAARAVGQAVGANPVGYLIPCHRVIRGTGALGGYRWGLNRKRAILGWEAARSESREVS